MSKTEFVELGPARHIISDDPGISGTLVAELPPPNKVAWWKIKQRRDERDNVHGQVIFRKDDGSQSEIDRISVGVSPQSESGRRERKKGLQPYRAYVNNDSQNTRDRSTMGAGTTYEITAKNARDAVRRLPQAIAKTGSVALNMASIGFNPVMSGTSEQQPAGNPTVADVMPSPREGYASPRSISVSPRYTGGRPHGRR